MNSATFINGTRIHVVCPCGRGALYRAAKATLLLLQKEVRIKQWGGFSYSSSAPPVFAGLFWDEEKGMWEPDHNMLITIDAPELTSDDVLLYLTDLYKRVNRFYAQAEESQKKLWITVHPLAVLDVPERSRPPK